MLLALKILISTVVAGLGTVLARNILTIMVAAKAAMRSDLDARRESCVMNLLHAHREVAESGVAD